MFDGDGFVDKCWVRIGHGKAFELRRIPASSRMAASDRLLLSILRREPDVAREIISLQKQPDFAERMEEFAGAKAMAPMLYQAIFDLELAPALQSFCSTSGAPLLSRWREEVVAATKTSQQHNRLFLELIDSLGDLSLSVMVLKGPVLARTLYAKPEHRLSVDFDLLVREDQSNQVLERLQNQGFRPLWDVPGHCHQTGIGPASSLQGLTLRPCDQLEPWHSITLQREGWPFIELKSMPLETGLRLVEADRFWNDCQVLEWQGRRFLAPSLIDHLLLELTHLRKHGFQGWQWLYDVHLLVLALQEECASWDEFIRRCQVEGVEGSAWAALAVVVDRLASPVPAAVLGKLRPRQLCSVSRLVTFSVEPAFLWNAVSLPVLCLNAAFTGDAARKWRALRRCLLPDWQFLTRYYLQREQAAAVFYPLVLLLHWCILLLPSSLSRRTLGPLIWKGTGYNHH